MSDQPTALMLAATLEEMDRFEKNCTVLTIVAAELRRLHAANLDCVEHYEAVKEERDALLEALKLALETLEGLFSEQGHEFQPLRCANAIVALRAALEQSEQSGACKYFGAKKDADYLCFNVK